MYVNDLELPSLLVELIDTGRWPRWIEEENKQEITPILGADAARKVSPDEDRIVLMVPPFHTISDEVDGGNEFWSKELTSVGQIDYRRAVIIADFGLGSDSPIVLYYEEKIRAPRVMFLKWQGNGPNVAHHWHPSHDSFEAFASDVGLA